MSNRARRSPGTTIAQKIPDRHADDLLAVEDKWPNLRAETARAFDDPQTGRSPGLEAIAMVETEVERNGRTSRERRFSTSSLPRDAALIAQAVRGHRQSENRLHRILDRGWD